MDSKPSPFLPRPRLTKVDLMKTKVLSEQSIPAAGLLSAMANPKRLMILCSLVEGEVPVGVLAAQVGLSQSALSQHLAVLRNDGLVNTRREGQTILYALADGPALRVIETLHGIYCGADPACEV